MAMTSTLTNITPEVWRNVVLASLRKDLVGEIICNKNFKQEVWGKGDTLNILSMGTLTDNDYDDNNITYEALSDSKTQLVINKERYVAFKDEDAERAKISANYMTELMTDAAYQIGDYWDALILQEHANAGPAPCRSRCAIPSSSYMRQIRPCPRRNRSWILSYLPFPDAGGGCT